MTTYVYETIPQSDREKPEYFEIKQSMQDAPLKVHPDSGKPVRRVILGGYGVLSAKSAPTMCENGGGECCGGPGGCRN
jgi:predicted nucleic acid-binding Zn ribbon protein